jgi:hypothetical protein
VTPRADTLVVEGGCVRYSLRGEQVWQFLIDDLRLVGEWTNDSGPADDYYYLFVVGNPPRAFEAPMYANPHFTEALGRALDGPVTPALNHSTTFNSRVMWPPQLAGVKLLTFSPEARAPGLWNRVLDRVVPLVHSELSGEVSRFLESREAV